MRRRAKELSEQERNETLDALYMAAGSLKGRDAAKEFLRDLLTESERIMLGRRILIARALLSGLTHDDIVLRYKVGKDTTMRISRWLEGQFPKYEEVIADADVVKEKRKEHNSSGPFSFRALKKKYPLHFLLFPPYDI